jgi:hypothetical protein
MMISGGELSNIACCNCFNLSFDSEFRLRRFNKAFNPGQNQAFEAKSKKLLLR